jgi:cytosine/adenosine deaminase-related metal-dependent hydrolase
MAQAIKLSGARVGLSANDSERIDLVIKGGRILPFDSHFEGGLELDLTGYLLLPGLINAHDHLEFNLFPRLGRPPYANASEWAADVYRPDESPVKEHLQVPKRVRLLWGGIKNLLSGVTTVAHHNPYQTLIFNYRFPVRVVKHFGWAHSLAFSPNLFEAWRNSPKRWPFIIHAAEGVDRTAHAEVPRLRELGLLTSRTVLVHAVATTSADLQTIAQSGASIVWCPVSNLFTLGKTLSPEALGSGVTIALGTDSALTAQGDLIDHLKCAGSETWPLVTTNAARILHLNAGRGTIRERGVADVVAVVDEGQTPAAALHDLHPELVMVRGQVMLLSDRFASRTIASGLHAIHVEERGRYLVRADIPALYAAAARVLGPEIRLAGRRVCC